MSGQSTTLIYALPLDAAQRVRDEFLGGMDADLGPDDHPIGLYSASRNNHVEASLQPLIRTAGITGLAHLEALAGFRADKPDTGGLPAADHGAVLSGASLQAATDGLRALLAALARDVDIVRRAMPELADMDDAMLARELGLSPDDRRRHLDRMSQRGVPAGRIARPHRYALLAHDGALYETAMFLVAYLDILEVALAQGLAVVLVCWLY